MKKGISIVICLLSVLFLVSSAHATLELRDEGTSVEGTYRLIYDTDLNITWYDYTSYANWETQMDWAANLSVNFGGNIVDDWRLPTAMNQDGTGPCIGWNCTESEMGHLFYTELGNKGYCDTSGNCPQSGFGLTKTGDFQNLQASDYWSGTEYADEAGSAWRFNTAYGVQEGMSKRKNNLYALAVRPGDVTVVPEPISSVLFVTGGMFLAGRGYIRKKHNHL